MVEVKHEPQNNEARSNNNNPNSNSNSSSKQLEPEAFRKLFIGGLSLNTTDDALREFYSKFGELLDCVVMRDGQTKKSRGFGFVSFSCKEEVDNAMNARPHEIDGKTVDPKRAVPRDQSFRSESNLSTKRLYVSGVREEHTEDDFSTYFNGFGKVGKVEIITDKATGKPRGFAFISFDDYDAVDKCVLQKSHMIKNYRCDVKKALSKDDMNRAQQVDRDRAERGTRSRGNQRGGPGPWGGPNGGGGGRPRGSGADYPPWGGGPPAAWAGPPGQWGGPGGYGGGYGAGYGGGYGGAPGGGWGPAAAGPAGGGAWGGPPAAGGGAWGGPPSGAAGGWSADANPGGWGGQGGPAGGAPSSQNPAAAAAGWNASSAGQWSSGAAGGGAGGAQRF